MHKETDLAYLAGIIDGEGTIYIGNFSKNPKNGSPYYQTLLKVTNTNYDVIEWLKKLFGGWISTYTPNQTAKNSRRQAFSWSVTGKSVDILCPLILPYLIIKREECEIMMKMRETYKRSCAIKGKQGIQPTPQDILTTRHQYFLQLRSLHCRNYKNK